jgi:hypothetical protein
MRADHAAVFRRSYPVCTGDEADSDGPAAIRKSETENRKIKVPKSPADLLVFKYIMIWHPRVNTDAAHDWLRGEIRRIGKDHQLVSLRGEQSVRAQNSVTELENTARISV